MNIVIILHDQLSILSILKKKRDTFFQLFWVQESNRQTNKQANRQTDIEHGFFEASTQKAPSGQKV